MREITFRGKDAKTGEWVYGDLSFHHYGLHHNGIPFIRGWSRDADNSPKNYWSREVVPETVGQYIGLDAQSGERIFEGDIVDYNGTPHQVVFEDRFGCAYFGIRMSGIETWDFCSAVPSNLMRIIGNIHDNPELIEVSK